LCAHLAHFTGQRFNALIQRFTIIAPFSSTPSLAQQRFHLSSGTRALRVFGQIDVFSHTSDAETKKGEQCKTALQNEEGGINPGHWKMLPAGLERTQYEIREKEKDFAHEQESEPPWKATEGKTDSKSSRNNMGSAGTAAEPGVSSETCMPLAMRPTPTHRLAHPLLSLAHVCHIC